MYSFIFPLCSLYCCNGLGCFCFNFHQGDNVPPPLTSFEATGFPSELRREVWISFFICNSVLARSLYKFTLICNLSVFCENFCDCWRSDVKLQDSCSLFSIFTFCRRCDICSREELNVVRCATPLWGVCIYLERPCTVDQFWEGLSESPKFLAETAASDDSVCLPLGLNRRRGLLLLY